MIVVGCSSYASKTSPRPPTSKRGGPASISRRSTAHKSASGASLPINRANADWSFVDRRATGRFAERCGGGGGGEYASQVGFGWSNGVALEFLAHRP
mmetsp:Transcript_30037/g.103379  ORF Transcript_30037/g.103379 Transcript_30037/m.103379 type:complete len:97 (-) Transcript_30037:192-482(-)